MALLVRSAFDFGVVSIHPFLLGNTRPYTLQLSATCTKSNGTFKLVGFTDHVSVRPKANVIMNQESIPLRYRPQESGRKWLSRQSRILIVACIVTAMIAGLYVASTASYFLAASQFNGESIGYSEDVLTQIGTIRDHRLPEISGIAASVRNPDAYWVHNDSGNPAELFLIKKNGSVVARFKVLQATNRDWEDICTCQLDGQNYICVADVGDNRGKYKEYFLYLTREPELTDLADNQERIIRDFIKLTFQYEDGPKNCEAVAFDRKSSSFLLAEKGFDRRSPANVGIYQLKIDSHTLKQKSRLVARRIANGQIKQPTAMSISADGSRLVISSYAVAAVWSAERNSDWSMEITRKPTMLPLPVQRQGEAISLDFAGKTAVTTSEHTNQPIWRINIAEAIKTMTKSQSK